MAGWALKSKRLSGFKTYETLGPHFIFLFGLILQLAHRLDQDVQDGFVFKEFSFRISFYIIIMLGLFKVGYLVL